MAELLGNTVNVMEDVVCVCVCVCTCVCVCQNSNQLASNKMTLKCTVRPSQWTCALGGSETRMSEDERGYPARQFLSIFSEEPQRVNLSLKVCLVFMAHQEPSLLQSLSGGCSMLVHLLISSSSHHRPHSSGSPQAFSDHSCHPVIKSTVGEEQSMISGHK